ncbi:hypothetical protein GW915_04930 [bacterium]|nr:hypothetical protein [bacterium]
MSRDLSSNFGNLRDFRIDQNASGPGAEQVDTSSSSLREWSDPRPASENSSPPQKASWNSIDLSKPVPLQEKTSFKNKKLIADSALMPLREGIVQSKVSDSKWAIHLALEERRMDREGSVDYHNSYRKHELLKAKTAEFMTSLQKNIRENAEVFNSSRQSAAHHVHVYKVSRTEHDFMLYRNSVKLIVSAQQAGKIFFAFNQYLGDLFAPGRKPVFEIQASWGALDQLYWSYRGERLEKSDVVRFFFSEFVQQSYR